MKKNIDELKKQEIEQITENPTIEMDDIDLETLIIQGTETKIPIQINYPIYNRNTGEIIFKPYSAMIKPLNNIEANNANKIGINSNKTTINLEVVKKGLLNSKGEPFKPELITKMPTGVIDAIVKQILEISGIEINSDENMKLAKKMMGF